MINRRDFIKLAGTGICAIALSPIINCRAFDTVSWPKINICDLPLRYQNILSLTQQLEFSSLGMLKNAPVIQTNFNKKFIEIAKHSPCWRFVTDQPIGIAWHWFGDTSSFASTWYPNGTAKEYIENGLCGDRSVQFVVGDGKLQNNQNLLNDKLSIAQAEIPDENGNWVSSAHIINVDRKLYENGIQYFANAYYSLCRDYGFHDPSSTTILQRLYQPGFNNRPNIQLIGIEIQGHSFNTTNAFPSNQKIANALSISLALIKRHNISSPAFNTYGHQELDFNKDDPGKNFIFEMKLLIGIYALISNDQELLHLVFNPFTINGTISKRRAVTNYFNFIKDYFKRTTEPTAAEYWLNYFQFDTVSNIMI